MPGLPSRKETLAIVHKSRYDIFLVLSNFIGFLYFVPNIFSRIIVNSFAILATDPTSLSLSPYIYMVFTTEEFLEVAVESWPEWDLNPRPLNSVQTL